MAFVKIIKKLYANKTRIKIKSRSTMTKTIDFSKYSSVRIGGKIDVEVVEDPARAAGRLVIGAASNLLVSPRAKNIAVLGKAYDYIRQEGALLHVGAATPSRKLFNFCKAQGLGGLEFLKHLPGKIGGLVKMNAGMKGDEIFNFLTVLTTHAGSYEKRELHYGYRFFDTQEVILEAVFKLSAPFDPLREAAFEEMRKNQPRGASFGSIFKNPTGLSAGKLIDDCGLAGRTKGGAQISPKHANFLINTGGASFGDAMFLIELAKKSVEDKFGVSLQTEVVIV